MANALGQDPVQVPHWMQLCTIFLTAANSPDTRIAAVSTPAIGSILIPPTIYLIFLADFLSARKIK
jgi:hypothetical protein